MSKTLLPIALAILLAPGAANATPMCIPGLPQLYGKLFEDVQAILPDTKAFVDATPRQPPAGIVAEYHNTSGQPGFELRSFVDRQFVLPAPAGDGYRTDPGHDVREHIDALWSVLERQPAAAGPGTTLLPLPHRYVVPGGRFNEVYYWDSYFTMLGLEESGRHDLVADMVRNFAWLIDRYGHVPNGNRTYYLSRSQPPFFSAMVGLLADRDGDAALVDYLPQLEAEHAFWMDGADALAPGTAYRRAVRMADGAILNRYWDECDTPRPESHGADVATAAASHRPPAEVYRNLRAGAESGWDFSSRWFADGRTLPTIRTVDLVPPDLNSLLHHLEATIARAHDAAGDADAAAHYRALADTRASAIRRHLWDPQRGVFTDHQWADGGSTGHVTAAALYPLFFGIADQAQADAVARTVRETLLQPHGIAATTVRTGEQWDAPNGWAPLQWIAIRGLDAYGHDELARTIARRWIARNIAVFESTGKLVEKYDVTTDAAAGGGEYALQDGFGWTNGVLRRLMALYPE